MGIGGAKERRQACLLRQTEPDSANAHLETLDPKLPQNVTKVL